ncbi:DUF3693 domain-containing protein [Vibrio hannami]|uniref:DUF3693 domain-containing protein n=1 Tax=Vibrio hannami TaxID=2717094 RepID=UPI002410B2DC|nr:DUF3693 domain-containing protein [Vibrio hannami]MDG3085464.1 DUF3693 domain-containing protein [Vibrio hannami]
MYQSNLLDAYKKAQNYVQDKQVAHDLGVNPTRIYEMRRGIRKISDKEALILAEGANISPEVALLGCHADQNDDPRIKAIWERLAKFANPRDLSKISAGYTVLTIGDMMMHETIPYCVLCVLC